MGELARPWGQRLRTRESMALTCGEGEGKKGLVALRLTVRVFFERNGSDKAVKRHRIET